MTKKTIHLVMATRPNIMKIAPLYHALRETDWAEPVLVHTGQHYDRNMSGAFLEEFDLPAPHHNFNVGSGTYAEQTGRTMTAYEALCLTQKPDLCVVAGDVNATLACAITAKKLGVTVAHLEAGLRSFDRSMPEEINRLATDAVCDLFLTPSPDATRNLLREGVYRGKIAEIGNVMIDAYEAARARINATPIDFSVDTFAVVTLHRAGNVDDPERLADIVHAIEQAAELLPLVFPVHPRTRSKLVAGGFMKELEANKNIHLRDPLSYIPFMALITRARLVITDGGGIQEESSYLGIPCLTLRTTTERPVTINQGTNALASPQTLTAQIRRIMAASRPQGAVIAGWDGQASQRAAAYIESALFNNAGSGIATRFSVVSKIAA